MKKTGDTDLIENYGGQIEIEKADEYTYLWFVISSTGKIWQTFAR